MSAPRILTGAVVLVALGVGALLFVTRGGDAGKGAGDGAAAPGAAVPGGGPGPAAGPGSPKSGTPATGPAAGSSGGSGSPRDLVESDSGPRVWIDVLDENERPLPGAVLIALGQGRRWRLADGSGDLGVADDGGRITVSAARAQAAERSGGLSVWKEGYVPAMVAGGSLSDSGLVVHLDTGMNLDLRCIDERGKPVSGVKIAVSRAPLPASVLGTLTEDGSPGGDPNSAIYVGTSDAFGTLQFTSMRTGGCEIAVDGGTEGVVKVGPRSDISLPMRKVELTFGPILGALVKTSGDVVVSHIFVNGAQFPATTATDWGVERWRTDLAKRFPQALQTVAVYDPNAVGGRRVDLHLLTGREGERVFPVDMQPVQELQKPLEISLAGDGSPTEPGGSLAIVDGSGGNPPFTGFTIAPRGFMSGLVPLRLATGPLYLPEGTYPVRCSNPWMRADFTPHELTIPGKNVLELKATYRPCEFRRGRGVGALPEDASLTIEAAGRKLTIGVDASGGFPEIWLPTGPVVLRLEEDVTVLGEGKDTVEPSKDYTPQVLDLPRE